MATVTPRRPADLHASHGKIRHPLQRLRKYIRCYVAIECTLLILFVLSIWFWVGLTLDYGLFKLSALSIWKTAPLDWVQTLPTLFPVLLGLLLALLATLVAFKAGMRLFREFSDPALAILLERRYPGLLGDRLITAVELADISHQTKYGYSKALIEQTIHDAAEAVDQVQVAEVFNWRRLVKQGFIVLGTTLGIYLVVGALFCLTAKPRGNESKLVGYGRLNDVAGIWTDRHLLLQKSYWPRHVHLEVFDFPHKGMAAGDEKRIARSDGRADLQVRAVKWLVPDAQGTLGWRAMTWKDVPALVPEAKPDDLPAEWQGMTVDQIEAELRVLSWVKDVKPVLDSIDLLIPAGVILHGDKGAGQVRYAVTDDMQPLLGGLGKFVERERPLTWQDVKARAKLLKHPVPDLPPWRENPTVDALRKEAAGIDPDKLARVKETVFGSLEKQTDTARLTRRVRRLDVPESLQVLYWNKSAKIDSEMNMHKSDADKHEYGVTLTDLTDSVQFTVRAEDFYTNEKKITVLPPPALLEFKCDQEKPAYLYFRIDTGWPLPKDTTGTAPAESLQETLAKELELGKAQKVLSGERRTTADLALVAIPGDTTKIPAVPAGTNVVIKGRVDRALREPPVIKPGKDGKAVTAISQLDPKDKARFSVRLNNLQFKQQLRMEFIDEDNVRYEHEAEVEVAVDTEPNLSVGPADHIRRLLQEREFQMLKIDSSQYKDNPPYVMTVNAWVPIVGKIKDDHGVFRLDYVYKVTSVDPYSTAQSVDLVRVAGAVGLAVSPLNGLFTAPTQLVTVGQKSTKTAVVEEGRTPVRQFLDTFPDLGTKSRYGVGIKAEDLARRLKGPVSRRDGKEVGATEDVFELDPSFTLNFRYQNWSDEEKRREGERDASVRASLDLPKLDASKLPRQKPLAETDTAKVQPRYLLELFLEAADNDVEGGPHVNRMRVGRFLLVSEQDLILFVSGEEEKLNDDLAKVLEDLTTDEQNMVKVVQDLATLKDYSPAAQRLANLDQRLDVEMTEAGKVFGAYERIIKELFNNRLNYETIRPKEQDVARPLMELTIEDMPKLKQRVQEYYKFLEDKGDVDARRPEATRKAQELREEYGKVVAKLKLVTSSMSQAVEFSRILKLARDLEERAAQRAAIMEALHENMVKDLLKGLGDIGVEPKKP